MNVNIHWGNLGALSGSARTKDESATNFKYVKKVLDKNLEKVGRLIKRLDPTSVRVNIHFTYNESTKRYKVTVYFTTPKESYHITENGFSIEEAIKNSIHNLRRKFRKDKEKRISLKRK